MPREKTPQTPKQKNERNRTAGVDNENDSSASDNYLYSLANPSLNYRKETKITVGGHKFAITVDTGASINVMDQETFSKLKGISLHQTNVKSTHTM